MKTEFNKPAVLIVDDELEILSIHVHYLNERFEVHQAGGVDQALQILKKTPIQVLITDLVMPGKDGRMLLSITNREHRKPIRLVLSGYLDEFFNSRFLNEYRVFSVLKKPLESPEAFLRTVEEACEEYAFRYLSDPSEGPNMLNTEKIIARLGVSRPTLYKYLRAGLPSKQAFGRRFFDWNEVMGWMNRQPNHFSKT